MKKIYYYFNISNINMEGRPVSEDDYSSYILCPVNKGVCVINPKDKVSDIVYCDKSEYRYPQYYIKPHFNLIIEGETIRRNCISNRAFSGYYIRNLINFIKDHPNEFKEIKESDIDKLKLVEKLAM